MSNVPPLTKYMLSGRWKDELNSDNPLGMRGEIASTYAALIETMWSGRQSCAVPRHFKVYILLICFYIIVSIAANIHTNTEDRYSLSVLMCRKAVNQSISPVKLGLIIIYMLLLHDVEVPRKFMSCQ